MNWLIVGYIGIYAAGYLKHMYRSVVTGALLFHVISDTNSSKHAIFFKFANLFTNFICLFIFYFHF